MLELLTREIDLLVGRLRDFTPARYAAAALPFADRAGVARHLAQQLVTFSGSDRQLPVLPPLACADLVAVTGADLAAARPAGEVVAAALAEVLLHRFDLDGSPPGRAAALAVLAVLDPSPPATGATAAPPERLLALARRRCPAWS